MRMWPLSSLQQVAVLIYQKLYLLAMVFLTMSYPRFLHNFGYKVSDFFMTFSRHFLHFLQI